jgi:cytochrome c oxidase subunit 3
LSVVILRDPFRDDAARFLAGRQGLWIFLVSLGVLFASTLAGLLIIRLLNADIWPADLPPLPEVLRTSTLLLVISSVTVQMALLAARRPCGTSLVVWLVLTSTLGLVFLGLQAWAWAAWLREVGPRWEEAELYRYALASFYVLTGLHALHVIGGLIPMLVVTGRAMLGAYRDGRYAGVFYCTAYWHFLDVVWIILFVTMWIAV